MKKFYFKELLQENGWKKNVRICTNKDGLITEILDEYKGKDYDETIEIAIPGIPNAHSHAFQYGMAGMTENHPLKSSSDFWTWRKTMYDLALNIEPEDLQNIATMLYSEMLRNGYTHVAEFHYLHHDKKGEKYENIGEMGERILIAAKEVGMELTLVPIYYNQGNFNKDHLPEQRRFISENTDDYIKLLEKSQEICKIYNGYSAIGVHSIRAVKDYIFKEINYYNNDKLPFHLHISEQKKEIDDCLSHYKCRPVEWLYNNNEIGINHHLVHATHLNKNEINLISKNNSNVILCPITEANLADGFFNFNDYQNKMGQWCIGSDSHIGLSPLEEIRWLDYGVRLQTNSRKTFKSSSSGNAGHIAMNSIFFNGMKAMGINRKSFFEKGYSLNFLEINKQQPLIKTCETDNMINTIFYSGDIRTIKNTYTRGVKRDNKNSGELNYLDNYLKSINKIKASI